MELARYLSFERQLVSYREGYRKVVYECVPEIRAANLSRVGINVTCNLRSFPHSPLLLFFSFRFMLLDYWNVTFK